MKQEAAVYPKTYLLLFLILIGAFFVRIWRVGDLLGFYFDQGRDALVIWKLLNEGKFFLIGPVTGIEGIFLGPAYYYLLTPFYWLSRGDPVGPAIFLTFLTTVACGLLYYLGFKFHSRAAGLFAATIFAFSYFLVLGSRWLANPTPLLLIAVLFIWGLREITKGHKLWWPIIALIIGLSLQFEAAGAIFYIPTVILFTLWLALRPPRLGEAGRSGQRRNLPNWKLAFLSFGVFFVTLLPQILFDLRHEGVLKAAFYKFLIAEQSFKLSFFEVVKIRLPFYLGAFESIILPGWQVFFVSWLLVVFGVLAASKKFKTTNVFLILLIIVTPLVGFLFYRGNYGHVWEYYLNGVFPGFVLLLGIGLGELWRYIRMRPLVLGVFFLFFLNNGTLLKNYLTSGIDRPTTIVFGNQKQAVDWVFQDAKVEPLNVDAYVPPVIPYAYDYLFLWWGTTRYGRTPMTEQLPLLYTLYEQDPPHPERLEVWLARQAGIGKVMKEARFGGITVQRRERINTNVK